MAITVNDLTSKGDIRLAQKSKFWALNGTSADASGCEQLKAAPATGLSLHITSLIISSAAAITITIGEGETTPGTPDAVILGPIAFAANQTLPWKFDKPITLTAATNLVVDASGAGAVTVFVEGYTA